VADEATKRTSVTTVKVASESYKQTIAFTVMILG
jgi:hypothetical protein